MKVEGLKRFNILCDMDGCIADFDKRFIELYGKTFQMAKKELGSDKAWQIIKDCKNFWTDLEPMPGVLDKLWPVLQEASPAILTAPPTRDIERAKIGKRLWVDQYFGRHVPVFFRRGRLKANLAAPDAILIDDTPEVIKYWELEGGIGILHTSAEETLEKLKEINDTYKGVLPIDTREVSLVSQSNPESGCNYCGNVRSKGDSW